MLRTKFEPFELYVEIQFDTYLSVFLVSLSMRKSSQYIYITLKR